MRRGIAIACVAAAAVLALAPSAAWGADAREYQLQLSPVTAGGQAQMIVTAVLTPGISLPATVSVPVPAGATLLWSGELLGGDPADDPFREASVERVGSMDVYEFTLEQSYVGQVEVALGPPRMSGAEVSMAVAWTNPGPEVLVSASVVAEPGARRVQTTPPVAGGTRTNDVGETLYPLGGRRVPSGGVYALEATWSRGGSFPVLPVSVGTLAVAVTALVLVWARERGRARRADVAPGEPAIPQARGRRSSPTAQDR